MGSAKVAGDADDFREWVAPARFGLTAVPVDSDSGLVLRLVIHNFNPAFVTGQYKSEQEFSIRKIKIFSAAMLKIQRYEPVSLRASLTACANSIGIA